MAEQDNTGGHWFPRTKLHPPLVEGDFLERPRLLNTIHEVVTTRRLTLLSAPAGYGKTTLLASLPGAFPELPLAWLSLDEEDNDPVSFLTVFLFALQHVVGDCCTNAQTLLTSLPNPASELRRCVSVLINDILQAQPDPFVLVLDDLHAITAPAVHDALNYLLDHLPPPFRLAVATRHDPPLALARLRARGQLAELRQTDLRFTQDEASALLNEHLGLALSAIDIARLQHRTEGWAAGLRLLAASLRNIAAPGERTAFIDHLAHTHRYVFDFLADEVLNRQQPDIRTFLLETAILTELTPTLCQAVTGRAAAGAILEDLYRRNLFLVAVSDPDTPPHTFRCHRLFATFLRQQLAREFPDQVAELHRRAAETHTDPVRAIRHYLLAEMWPEAARAIEAAGRSLLNRGALERLHDWIMALPESIRQSRPWLLYFLGTIAAQRGEFDRAKPLLEAALCGFRPAKDRVGPGEALLLLGFVASGRRDLPGARTLLEQALDYPLPLQRRTFAHINRAWVEVYAGDWARVDQEVNAAIETALTSGHPDAYSTLALQLRAPLLLAASGVAPLERYCRQALARFDEGVGPVQAGALGLLSSIYALQGKLDEAEQSLHRARHMSEQLGGFVYLDVALDYGTLIIALIRRDYRALETYWRGHLPRFESLPGAQQYLTTYLLFQGRALWYRKHLKEAWEILTRMEALERPQDLPENHVSRALLRGMLAISDGRYAAAEEILGPIITLQRRARHTLVTGNARLWLAYAYLQWNRTEEALAETASLLTECERQGMPGLILIEGPSVIPLLRLAVERDVHTSLARNLLGIMESENRARAIFIPTTGETISPREAEVLHLVAQGASNRAIAERLVITERTVKSHVTSILRKLDVTSRTQAAARARELNLL